MKLNVINATRDKVVPLEFPATDNGKTFKTLLNVGSITSYDDPRMIPDIGTLLPCALPVTISTQRSESRNGVARVAIRATIPYTALSETVCCETGTRQVAVDNAKSTGTISCQFTAWLPASAAKQLKAGASTSGRAAIVGRLALLKYMIESLTRYNASEEDMLATIQGDGQHKVTQSDNLICWYGSETLGVSNVGAAIMTAQNPLIRGFSGLDPLVADGTYGMTKVNPA